MSNQPNGRKLDGPIWPPVEPIEGLSIRLWCIALKDASAIAEIMTPDVSRWLASWPPNLTVEAAAERISRAQSAMQEKRELHFRVEERERNLTIGYVSVAQSATDRGVGHLSYWLGSAFQGKGYMTEAVRRALAAGFRYLDLERIEGGHPSQMGGPPFPTITKSEEAEAFVEARIAEGSDFIKIIYDNNAEFGENQRLPALDKATMKAVIDAAHKRHKLVVVHILTEEQARDAITAGADGLAHLFIGDTVSSDFGRFAASHHVFVIPTLTTLHMICGKSPGPSILADAYLEPYIDAEWRSLLQVPANPRQNHLCSATTGAMRQLIAARVPILTGTDSPVPGNVYGASVHVELELLVKAGLTRSQALAAATSLPAKTFGLNDRGSIQQGRRADLLLVQGDPTQDIRATRRIVDVWKRGSRVQR